ncbi:glutamine--tRNA ligase [Buchnera aphidicola]|uniref:glutamine--tRNA ligase n=1 Tax=Buchnera aphidicola TaxID=9 RepID=UPI003BEF3950
MNTTINEYNNNFISHIIDHDLKKQKKMFFHTRFPPEPNGYLHIGHAKSICLNFELAKIYQGKCNLRFDDTNPIKENIKYINAIKYDITWLGYQKYQNIHYASEYFEIFYQYAKKLIKKGLAYVDELTKEEIHKYRGTLKKPGINSPYRNRSIEENITLFKKMKNGEFAEGKASLRAKINMNSACIIMRDPVLYRIIFCQHHQTKKKWCIYPMYDFAHCISDAIEKITHSLCTLEFQDNKNLYNWILKNINTPHRPKQYEFSRLNLEYSILSKRKLKILVEKKIVSGWDDPRMPTLSGMRRRGYTPSSIKEFCKNIGITKQNNLIELSMLEYSIRNELNKTAIRTMAILDPIKIYLYNLNENHEEVLIIPKHPYNDKLGTQKIFFTKILYIERNDFQEKYNNQYKKLKIGCEIRLRYAYIIKAEKIKKDKNENIIYIICSCNLKTLGKKPIDKKNPSVIHWISVKYSFPAQFRLYEPLFNIKSLDKKEDFLLNLNSQSLVTKKGFIEKNIAKKIHKKIIQNNIKLFFQFERIGYFCTDIDTLQRNYLIFNRTVSLRDTWNEKNKKIINN